MLGALPVPTARYSFTTSDCVQRIFPDTSGKHDASSPSFRRNSIATQCSKGMGIETTTNATDQTQLVTPPLWLGEAGITNLLDDMKRTGRNITLEFWLMPAGGIGKEESSIFMLGSIKSARAPVTDACDDFDFQVNQRKSGTLQIIFRSSKPFPFYPCFRYEFPGFTVQPGQLIHLVVSLGNKHQQVFVNGRGGPLGADAFFLKAWTDSTIMTFFSGVVLKDPLWQGRLYQFSVYDRVFSQRDVEQSLAEGLDGDEPYSTPYHVTINEDAEAEPGSHPLEWYARPYSLQHLSRNQAQDLQKISLRIRPVQHDVETLRTSLHLTRSGNRVSTALAYITGLPSRGSLFHYTSEGFVLLRRSSNEPIAILVDDPTSLIFLPAHNEHSVPGEEYTYISYCATSHVIFDPLQCVSSNIYIFVNPVNDPPIAFASPTSLQALEGNETAMMPTIQLGGTDVDQQDSIAMIQITKPPQWGSLMLRVTSFRNDGLPHGTLFSSENNFTVASHDLSDSVYVKYLFGGHDPSLPRHLVPGNDATDYFQFRVSDQKGGWSLEETVHVDILSAVETSASYPFIKVLGDGATTISINAIDASGYARPLATFIHSVPDERFGNLLDLHTNTTLGAGSQIAESDVIFFANPAFCASSFPTTLTNFAYRAVALDNEMERSISPIATQDIEIQCPNRPIYLRNPSSLLHLRAFSLDTTNTTACGDSIYASLPPSLVASCGEAIILDRLQVSTAPRNLLKQVVVTVKPGRGFVTFVDDAWLKVRPLQGRKSLAYYNVVFLASLGDLQDVFNGLTYRSLVPGNTSLDSVVQYADCPTDSLNQTATSNSSCPISSLSIPVLVDEGVPFMDFQPMPFPAELFRHWLGYPIAYFLYEKFWSTVWTLMGSVCNFLWWYLCEWGAILYLWWRCLLKVLGRRNDSLDEKARASIAGSNDIDCVVDQEHPGVSIRDDSEDEEEGNPKVLQDENGKCWNYRSEEE